MIFKIYVFSIKVPEPHKFQIAFSSLALLHYLPFLNVVCHGLQPPCFCLAVVALHPPPGLFFLFSSVLQFKTVERQVMSVLITTYLYRCLIGLLVSLAADLHHHHNSTSPLKSSPSLPRNIPPPPRNLPLPPQKSSPSPSEISPLPQNSPSPPKIFPHPF